MLRYFAVAFCLQPQYSVLLFLLAVLFKEALLTKLDLLCNNCATYIADDLVSTIDYTKVSVETPNLHNQSALLKNNQKSDRLISSTVDSFLYSPVRTVS